MSDDFVLHNIAIKVDGISENVNFTNLTVSMHLARVCTFHFDWRQEEAEATLNNHINFHKTVFGKEVSINIDNNLYFNGLITGVDSYNNDALGAQYSIKGEGLFAKYSRVPVCNSFEKMSLKDILGKMDAAHLLESNPQSGRIPDYIVQYNQTSFEFIRMLAVRFGQWMYYNGKKMVFGKPDNNAVELSSGALQFFSFTSQTKDSGFQTSGFDLTEGVDIHKKKDALKSSQAEMIKVALEAGGRLFPMPGALHTAFFAENEDLLAQQVELHQKAKEAKTVAVFITTDNTKVKLGGKIKVTDSNNKSAGEYYVISANFFCHDASHCSIELGAVPAEVEVPPYTNPNIFQPCHSQPAIVVDNEDEKNLDRIKVQFPWQKAINQKTPWLHVMVPHAGKDKGFRFLPEVGEQVMVGFVNDNPEKPYVIGAFYTSKHSSGTPKDKNNAKVIGSKTGRRLEINDGEGYMGLSDNFKGSFPKNCIEFDRDDSTVQTVLKSAQNKENYTSVVLENEKQILISLVSGGSPVAEIKMTKDGKKVQIKAEGDITIAASGNLNLSGHNVNISAGSNVKVDAKSNIELKATADLKGEGINVNMKASAEIKVEGAMLKAEGKSMSELKGAMVTVEGSGMTQVKGGMVMIN